MGVPKQQAARNRQAIVDAASRIFRERGVDGVGVADVMREAGFTHGGFYNHFDSKDALAAEACAAAFAAGAERLKAAIAADANGATGALRGFMEAFLTPEHCAAPGLGCPSAAMAMDAARQGQGLQSAYAQGIATYIDAVAACIGGSDAPSGAERAQAIDLVAGLVGAMVLARGVRQADPQLSNEILTAARKHLVS